MHITNESSAQTDRKLSKSVSPALSKTSLKNHSIVKPIGVPLTNLKSKQTNGKQQKTSFFHKTSKFAQKADPTSPSMESLASILASESESPTPNLPKSVINTKHSSSPIPGTVNVEDDLWELDSDLSDSGFGLSVKNVFAKSNIVEEKGLFYVLSFLN